MFATLGNIFFEVVGSPESMRTSRSWRYAEHPLVEALPKLQFMGAELDQVELELKFHASFCNPAAQRDAIYAAGDAAQALPLVFGNGVHKGYFVITEAEETALQLTDDGDEIAIQMHVTLREYALGTEIDPQSPPKPATPPIGLVPAPAPGATTSTTPAAPNTGASAILGAASAPGALTPSLNPDNVPPASIVRSAS
jgi:phage protein U